MNNLVDITQIDWDRAEANPGRVFLELIPRKKHEERSQGTLAAPCTSWGVLVADECQLTPISPLPELTRVFVELLR